MKCIVKIISSILLLLCVLNVSACKEDSEPVISHQNSGVESSPYIKVPDGEEDYFGQTITVPSTKKEIRFGYESNFDCTISVSYGSKYSYKWCNALFEYGSKDKTNINYLKIDKNDETTNRTATISVTTGSLIKSFTIVQEGKPIKQDEDVENFNNGHDYVDLGIKDERGRTLYWATCNICASVPEEYGDYYAWGEIEPKSIYTIANYEHRHTEIDFGEFIINVWDKLEDISGTEYDVARQKWGGSWRIPTLNEFRELYYICNWSWVEKNNVNGYKVTGPNGNWIFLPAAGCRYAHLSNDGSGGYYMSSTPDPYDLSCAYYLHFFSNYIHPNIDSYRYLGQSVRPVTE